MTADSTTRLPGYECPCRGCTNRVPHRLDICRTCREESAAELEDHEGEPDDFSKDIYLADHGYGEDPRDDI